MNCYCNNEYNNGILNAMLRITHINKDIDNITANFFNGLAMSKRGEILLNHHGFGELSNLDPKYT